ncbi:MAG: hypothetical protein ABIR30_13880 [Chitinophagaceae bacterium]
MIKVVHCLRVPLRVALTTLFAFLLLPLAAQRSIEEKLQQNITNAPSDSEKIERLGLLSQFYYANKNFRKGDSLIEKQIILAEATMNQNLVLAAYFRNIGYQSTNVTTKDRSANTGIYINRALAYAKANDLVDYVAMAYSSLAAINLADGKTEAALKNANLGFTTALNTNNDSAKVICAVQLGNIYQQRSDILMAFKTFTTAQNIAIEQEKENLLPPVYHAIAALYKKLGNGEIAKKYIHRSLVINRKMQNLAGRISDNIFLAKLNNYIAGKEYLQEAVQLADSVENVALKIEAEKILFSHMLLEERPSFMLDYLENKPELKNVYLNTGAGYLDWMMAEIYLYGGMPDSALLYFKKAEPSFRVGYDLVVRKNFFGELADCYKSMKMIPQALTYYRQSFDLSLEAADLRTLKSAAGELKDLYQRQGDYKQAFSYSLLYDHYKDSVEILGREKDLALLEIENVARQQQRDADFAKETQRRKYNLQYMLITIIVATVFLLMIMIGMFKVATTTIRLMGFLSLIFFFEFIILLLDNWIHHLTHGEPWKVWLIKIGIISILLPVHHYLEHKLIKYLLSRHLIIVRSRMSLSKLFGRQKKILPKANLPEESPGPVKPV